MPRAFRLQLIAIFGVALQAVVAHAAEPCEERRSSFRQIQVQQDRTTKEFRLSSQDANLKLSYDFAFHNVAANFYCDDCYGMLNVGGAFRLYGTVPTKYLKESLERGENFGEFSISVYGRRPSLRSLDAPTMMQIGSLSGEVANFLDQSEGNGKSAPVVSFYATDGCVTLRGILQGASGSDLPESFARLRQIAEQMTVAEVEVGSTNRELDRPAMSPPTPRLSPGPVHLKPITLDDIRSSFRKNTKSPNGGP